MKRLKKRKKTQPEENPEDVKLFNTLCAEVAEFGIETRLERGEFNGGICIMEDGSRVLFLNRKHSIEQRLALLYTELKKLKTGQPAVPQAAPGSVPASVDS